MNSFYRMRPLSAARCTFAGMLALAVAMGIGRFAFTPVLPMMQQDAGLSLAAAGWLAAANYLGYLLGALSAMRLRVPAPRALRFSLLAIALSTAAMGVLRQPVAWALLRLLAGVASAWVLVFASALTLERLTAIGHERLAGVVFSGVGVGIALAGILCLGALRAHWLSRQAWWALGVAAIALTALVWPAFDATPQVRRSSASQLAAGAGHRAHWRMILSYGLFGFGYIIPATFLPAMAKHAIPDPAVFGWAWPTFGLAAIVSTVAAGKLSARATNRSIWVLAQMTMALGVALPALWSGGAAIALSALLVGGTFMVVTMSGLREARRLAGAGAAPLMAAMTSAFAFGQVAGPLTVSALAHMGDGLHAPLLAGAALLVLGAMILPGASHQPLLGELA